MSVCTMLRLPMMMTSRSWRLTASTTSPSTTCEFAHAEAPVRVRVATSFATAFIWAENGSSRPGQIRENSSQVFRPSSRTPSSSTPPSRNMSPAIASRPYRNAQPPAGVPPDPSGSVTIPSRVMNSMTITLTVASLRSMLTGTYRRHHPDSSRRAGFSGRDLSGQGEGRKHAGSDPGVQAGAPGTSGIPRSRLCGVNSAG